MKNIRGVISILVLIIFALSSIMVNADSNNDKSSNGIKYFKELGIKNDVLKQISEDSLEMLNDIASNNKLDKEQAQNLLSSYIENSKTSVLESQINSKKSPEHIPLPGHNQKALDNSMKNKSFTNISNTSITNQGWSEYTWSENAGAHWIIKSKEGYRRGSGDIVLPTIYSPKGLDIPYMYFGAYTTDGSLCSDAGITYQDGAWRIFVNMLIWNDATKKYNQYWDAQTTIKNTSSLCIDYRTTSYSTYDVLELVVIDKNTWTTLSNPNIHKRTTSQILSGSNPINSDYTNLKISRETTLAQNSENLSSGGYIRNAKWSNVYIYNTVDCYKWASTHTEIAGKANKPEHWSKITVNSYSSWYSDDISISY